MLSQPRSKHVDANAEQGVKLFRSEHAALVKGTLSALLKQIVAEDWSHSLFCLLACMRPCFIVLRFTCVSVACCGLSWR